MKINIKQPKTDSRIHHGCPDTTTHQSESEIFFELRSKFNSKTPTLNEVFRPKQSKIGATFKICRRFLRNFSQAIRKLICCHNPFSISQNFLIRF